MSMNLDLEPPDRAFRDEVRAFIEAKLTPEMRAGQRSTSGSYPDPSFAIPWQKALNERGWLVPLWPREWGGTGWTGLQRFIFENECALAGAPLVHPMGVRYVGPVIIRFGTQEQKLRYLPRIRASEDYWCQGFSEPGAGSDLASLSLRATKDGEDYVLQGSKTWTTNAHHANWMFALVRTSREEARQNGISFLLIDMRSAGITVRPIRTIGGDHDVNEVFFDAVRVPRTQLVGNEGEGWSCAKYLLEFERGAGIFSPRLRGQLNRVAGLLKQGSLRQEATFVRFGELCGELDAFEWLELRTLIPLQPGQNPGPVSSILKLRSSRLKQAISHLGMEVLGEDALRWRADPLSSSVASDVAKVLVPDYCNSRAYTIFGGAAEIQLTLIARELLNAA
jgi:acyl-CoA dehydrogenase